MLTDAITSSPVVRRVLKGDMEVGVDMGGPEWYEFGPVKSFIEERSKPGMLTWPEFNATGAGSSMQNSVPSEMSAQSIINYARKRGLSLEEAKRHFQEQTGSVLPMITGQHLRTGQSGIENGLILPADLSGENWKVSGYHGGRAGMGAKGPVKDVVALDTHERFRINQAAMMDPQIAKLMKELGITDRNIPIVNSANYEAFSDMYGPIAAELGLPSAYAGQASRWTGGWDKTGLKTPPVGDYVQLLEDMILYNAQVRGMDTSPKGLRDYFERVLMGDDFIIPWTKKGAIPIR
jgi:hypothetical protein